MVGDRTYKGSKYMVGNQTYKGSKCMVGNRTYKGSKYMVGNQTYKGSKYMIGNRTYKGSKYMVGNRTYKGSKYMVSNRTYKGSKYMVGNRTYKSISEGSLKIVFPRFCIYPLSVPRSERFTSGRRRTAVSHSSTSRSRADRKLLHAAEVELIIETDRSRIKFLLLFK